MISIVERVAQVGIEGMNVAQSRKVGKHLSETFRDGLLGEFDFAHVEITNKGDFVARMNDRGRAAMEVEVSPPSLFVVVVVVFSPCNKSTASNAS